MKRSFWLQELEGELDASAALHDAIKTDVAIIGGGFVGLWTALAIVEKSPDTRVVILEQDICGGGASGRNGGFVMSWWPKINSLISCCGKEAGVWLAGESVKAIGEIGSFCKRHHIDAHFKQNGWLWTATTEAQRGAWRSVAAQCGKLGYSIFNSLPREEVRTRAGSSVHLEGVFDPTVATVQPASLVRGLRKIALEKGIKIYENTPVDCFDRGQPVNLNTPHGQVTATSVVIATNAWASAIPELSRLIVPVTSTMAITETIPERLVVMGWTGGEAITDSQLLVDYYRTTDDGRIAFGKGTGSMAYGANLGDQFHFNHEDSDATAFDFYRIFPNLKDVKLEQTWSGPIDRTYDSLPVFGQLKTAPNIVYGIGWSGNGVGPSRIGGKVLSSLVLGIKDEWSQCGLVNRSVKRFPPEPIRYIGGALVRGAVLRKEYAEAAGQMPGRLDKALAQLAPAGLEDKA